jgi:hypothetical protein
MRWTVTTVGPAADEMEQRHHEDVHAAWADFQACARELELAGFDSAGEHAEYGKRWVRDFLRPDGQFVTLRIERSDA